jgi:hypothetical protein
MIRLGTGLNASVEFSPDGRAMVIASGALRQAGWVKICDAETGKERRTLWANS